MSKDVYESPLASRYASKYMLRLFSADMRYTTWRRLWVALARAEHALGLPVTEEQVRELEEHVSDIDYEEAEKHEKEVRHDVMAHIYAYGKAAPGAAGIIHLGATSCYVTDNADIIIYRDAMKYIRYELTGVIKELAFNVAIIDLCPPSVKHFFSLPQKNYPRFFGRFSCVFPVFFRCFPAFSCAFPAPLTFFRVDNEKYAIYNHTR